MTTAEFPFTHFPLYMAGQTYVLTNDLSRHLFVTSEQVTQSQMAVDDGYVTGVLARIIGDIQHVNKYGFPYA